ncbi:MAG: hypothetical protein ABFC96_15080 [Thermoguttaceae bacterium]
MTGSLNHRHPVRMLLLGLGLLAGMGLTGCQADYGGQTLPSPFYMGDDVQYFPAGPQMRLSREAAAQKAYNDDMAQQQMQQQMRGAR